MTVMTSFHAEFRLLVSAHAASAQRIWNSVRQFVICGTFVIVNPIVYYVPNYILHNRLGLSYVS